MARYAFSHCRMRRLAAFLADVLVCAIFVGALTMIVGVFAYRSQVVHEGMLFRLLYRSTLVEIFSKGPSGVYDSYPLRLLFLCLSFGWCVYFLWELLLPFSPGKFLLSLRICRTGGAPTQLYFRLVRWLVKNGPVFMIYFWLATGTHFSASLASALLLFVGCGTLAIFGQSGQTLWDRLSDTCVYRIQELSQVAHVTDPRPGKAMKRSVGQEMPFGRRW